MEIEIACALNQRDDGSIVWIPPDRPAEISAVKRVLRVLGDVQEGLPLYMIVERINDLYETRVRLNNTMRAIRSAPELFDVGEDLIRASTRGIGYAAVMRNYESTPQR